MQVVKPVVVTDGMVISSNVTEIYSDWNAATAYVVGNRVNRSTTNRIYERLIAGTTATAPESDLVNWFEYSYNNKMLMFDNQTSSVSTKATDMIVTIATGRIDTLAVLNASGQTVRCQVRDGLGGTIVFDQTQSLLADSPTDWYAYFFYDLLLNRTQAIFKNIPPYNSSHVTLTVAGTTVSCGNVVFGTRSDLGLTQYGCNVGIIGYSRKVTDVFGVSTFVKRGFSKRLTATLVADSVQLNRVQRTFYNLEGTPCLWIGSDDINYEESLTLFGAYKDFSLVISYPTHGTYSLEVEGLI
jgi:hypothetical protein